jgi:hypothetical protein
MSSPLPVDVLVRLAERIVRGEAVFFVGAGFSIDNEGNTTSRMLARLLIRFEAWTQCLQRDVPTHLDGPTIERRWRTAVGLREDLRGTFSLEESAASDAPFLALDANQAKLNQVYYQYNDWMCSAFAELLSLLDAKASDGWKQFLAAVNVRENELRKSHRANDRVPLPPIDFATLSLLRSTKDRAKALFLQTVGFDSSSAEDREQGLVIMAGDPMAKATVSVEKSYRGKLLPRQHVLARLAREGLIPTLVTTNFDLLLEGAYRLAGFRMRDPRDDENLSRLNEQENPFPPATFQQFQSVSCAPHFFQRGEAKRLTNVLKIHGCTREYRERVERCAAALSSEVEQRARIWSAYLKDVIFTFREIQNWRDDFWSQDLIRTLLRSRTMVFVGYSAADQVLHDTFRSVYEEMEAAHRADRGELPTGEAQSSLPASERAAGRRDEDATAFFFDLAGVAGFHGAEIMSAASRAIGVPNPGRRDHPNRVAFNSRGTFPDLDACMIWLFHCVIRKRQRQALESDLGRSVTSLLRTPLAKSQLENICAGFDALVNAEQSRLRGSAAAGRESFERIIGWTQHFHVGLLREFAAAEELLRDFRPGRKLGNLRRWSWYYPTVDHPNWTAWSAVLELAIRRLTACWRGDEGGWLGDTTYAIPGDHPVVAFRGCSRPRTPSHLRILLKGFDRAGYPPRPATPSRSHHDWALQIQAIPWISQELAGTPGADQILRWASGSAGADEATLTRLLARGFDREQRA